jgi:hypothetical protein
MLSLFEIVAHSNCDEVLLQTFLKTCTEHQAFVNKVTSLPQTSLYSVIQHKYITVFTFIRCNFECECYLYNSSKVNLVIQ